MVIYNVRINDVPDVMKILIWYIIFFLVQWKLHLFELEEEMKTEPTVKYVLYQVFIIYLLDRRAHVWTPVTS